MYSTASEDLAKDWMEKKFPPVIESLNGLHLVGARETSAKSRRSGITTARADFINGASMDVISSGSTSAKRAHDILALFVDEVDGIASLTTTGEGKWLPVMMGHTNSYGRRKKIVIFGSPATEEASLTKEYYDQGDCRHFFVPCPFCGEPVDLKLDSDNSAARGLKAETRAGQIVDAYYVCEFCGEAIRNDQKIEMFSENPRAIKHPEKTVQKYHWRPTKRPEDPAFRSYYINSLYSPVGMLTFLDVAKERAKAINGVPEDMRSYINIYCGLPYKSAATKPKLVDVLEHRGNYERGTVPKNCLYLVMSVDVQQGQKNNPDKSERVEAEVMGVGLGYKTWSIDYFVFNGSIDDPYSGAWEDLYQHMDQRGWCFYTKEKIPLMVRVVFIDAGLATKTDAGLSRADVVQRFCERLRPPETPLAVPIKGFGNLTNRRNEKPDLDIPGAQNLRRYRPAPIGTGGAFFIEISTPYYKDIIHARLKINAQSGQPAPNAYMAFPRDYADDFFIQLTNYEKLEDNSFRDIGSHEVLDCRVYNLAAADFWLDEQKKAVKKIRISNGENSAYVEMTTTSKLILEKLQADLLACGPGRT
jgi:phage terminase large subunit GpA-like protein